MKIKLKDIVKAKENFGNFIKTTPLIKSDRLSKKYDAKIFLKREDLQPVRSYKIRGAYNLISSLLNKEKKAGIVCASAGNHAQGVAITCKELKIKGTIFMPTTTPEQKIYKTKKFGGEFIEVILKGDTFDEALIGARKFQKENKASFVHPFDDEKIIIGQATIGLEIFEQLKKKPDYIICPIGGGGLVSGLINVVNEISKNTKIIGVEPEGAAAMKLSLEKGKNISLEKIDTFVDGAAVKKEGELTFNTAKKYGLKVYTCPENRICSTIQEYLREDGIVVEPAGALSTDVLKNEKIQKLIKGKKVVLIISGSNFDFERLPEVKEKSLKFEGLKRYILVSFPQRPGALKEFLNFFGENEDITRFEYLKKSNKEKAPALVGIQTNKPENFKVFFKKLNNSGIQYDDITDNSLYFDMLI